jgi:hypothetical protein
MAHLLGTDTPVALEEAVAHLPSLMTVVSLAAKSEPLSVERVVMALCGLDDMFMSTYYACQVAKFIAPTRLGALAKLPTPDQFLAAGCPFTGGDGTAAAETAAAAFAEIWQRFQKEELGSELTSTLKIAWKGDDKPNPLLQTFRLRMKESAMLLWATNLAPKAMATASSEGTGLDTSFSSTSLDTHPCTSTLTHTHTAA